MAEDSRYARAARARAARRLARWSAFVVRLKLAGTKLIKRVEQARELLRMSGRVHREYGSGRLAALRRGMRLRRAHGFEADEAFQLGLLDPGLGEDNPSRFLSKIRLRQIQSSLNPMPWMDLTEDKGIFYWHCVSIGLPIPKLHAVFFKNAPGWACAGTSPRTRADWERLIAEDLPDEFVTKPARGCHGEGIEVYTRSEGKLVDSAGRECSPAEVVRRLWSSAGHDSQVIQERLTNHPDLVELNASRALQTVRINTLLEPAGTVRILLAEMKLALGDSVIDNIDFGATGNLVVAVSPDGVLHPSHARRPDGRPGLHVVSTHPETGRSFVGSRLPLWDEACALAERAAIAFAPFRTIGWDVALTPGGVRIVEGNGWYDFPEFLSDMPEVIATLLDRT